MITRNRSPFLAESRAQSRDRQLEIRRAALAVVAPLKRRPAKVWDEIARIDRPTRRFEKVQEPMRLAVRHGASPDAVVDFYLALLSDALAAAPQPITFDLTAACCRAIREQSEAVEAQAIAQAVPVAQNVERAIRESEEAISANHLYVAVQRAQSARRTG